MRFTAELKSDLFIESNKEEIAREIEDLLQMCLETNVKVFNIMTDEECKEEEYQSWIETLTDKKHR